MTRDIWFTSDTHFGHANSLKWGDSIRKDRFGSVEEMDEFMVERWNSRVKPGDLVYHLGDVMMGSKEDFKKLWPRLNGSKRLIVGNHDDIKFLSSGGFFKKVMMWRVWDDRPLVFSHVPLNTSGMYRKEWKNEEVVNIHGHTHDKGSPPGPYFSICVELHNFTPLSLEELPRSLGDL